MVNNPPKNRYVLFEFHFKFWNTDIIGIPVRSLLWVDRLLAGLTAQQKGTAARWSSNKTSLCAKILTRKCELCEVRQHLCQLSFCCKFLTNNSDFRASWSPWHILREVARYQWDWESLSLMDFVRQNTIVLIMETQLPHSFASKSIIFHHGLKLWSLSDLACQIFVEFYLSIESGENLKLF